MRKVIVGLAFLLFVEVWAVILLIPSYMVSNAHERETVNKIESVRESTILKEANDLNAKLAETNLKLKSIEQTGGGKPVSGIFEALLLQRDSSIRVRSMAFSRRQPEDDEVTITGIALSRDELAKFVKSLEGVELFNSVNIPVSNFAKDRNADFTIQIKGSF